MAQHWTELLPIDRYAVASGGLLHEYDRKILTLLYQPLVGSACISLYMTLWAEVEENRRWSMESSHHHLMVTMDLGLKDIYHARVKLEGIGLLKVYVKKEEDSRSFIYELKPPLTPEQFFLDGMLNIYLFRKIGKNQYARLKRFFSDQPIAAKEGFTEATRDFQEVFSSNHTEFSPHDSPQKDEQESYFGRQEQAGVQIDQALFDFELLIAGLNESLVPKKSLTKEVRQAISNLAFLYGVDAVQMKNILLSAVTEDNDINIEELRKSARDWYQFEHNDELPSLVDQTQPVKHRTVLEEPKTKEDQLLLYLETTSPKQVLKDISGNAEPAIADLKIIEDVLFKQKLLPGVVNVLIQYVMLKTDMKLTKSYVEKIAGHWARKQIKTAKAAMALAKNEHKQYIEWGEAKKAPKRQVKKQAVRTEMLPEWFTEEETSTEKPTESDDKKKKMEEALKKLRAGGD